MNGGQVFVRQAPAPALAPAVQVAQPKEASPEERRLIAAYEREQLAITAPTTLRHDLHALSLFFQYAEQKGWTSGNPVRKVKIPSDRDAVRITVLTNEQEAAYFAAARKILDKAGRSNLWDVGRLMINQGFRPEEIMHARREQFDAARRTFTVVAGKSKAAQRTVDLMEESVQILSRRRELSGEWIFPSQKVCRKTDHQIEFVP